MTIILNKEYWDFRWRFGDTGWDIGFPSPAIVEFVSQIENKNISILIPGCGNAYEAEKIFKLGFKNITLLDISSELTNKLNDKLIGFTDIKIVCSDYFDYNGEHDLVLEQTFFCALNPELREQYVRKTHQLLKNQGILAGLLFACEFDNPGPPFGGSIQEYENLFKPYFNIERLDFCEKSIEPRKGNEVFIQMRKVFTV